MTKFIVVIVVTELIKSNEKIKIAHTKLKTYVRICRLMIENHTFDSKFSNLVKKYQRINQRQKSMLFLIQFKCSCNFDSMNYIDFTLKTMNIDCFLSSSCDIFLQITVVTIKIRKCVSIDEI